MRHLIERIKRKRISHRLPYKLLQRDKFIFGDKTVCKNGTVASFCLANNGGGITCL